MIPLTTALPKQTASFSIQHQDQLMALGSCFAQHIGAKLKYYKFEPLLHPFGLLYNPASILSCLTSLLNEYEFTEQDIFQHQNIWHSYWHHSSFSSLDKQQMLDRLNQSAKIAQQQLSKTNRLIITFGTAYAYVHKAWQGVVANCHKLPQSQFIKKRLAVAEILEMYQPVFHQLKQQSPELQIIITVSPIRHIKDGIIENQRSKAILLLATEALANRFDFVHYFPAYEYLMDELRDYRFYAKDLLHPSETTIDWMWEKFEQTYFNASTLQLNQHIKKIKQAAAHRPFQPNSAAHQQFLTKQIDTISTLQKTYPQLNFSEERQQFEQQLKG